MVRVRRVSPTDEWADPASSEWRSTSTEEISLEPTPIASQPSLYVQAKFRDQPYGETTPVSVNAIHTGDDIYVRLSWEDETNDSAISDTNKFPDAAAVLFPVFADAPLTSMGSADQPVQAWLWRADAESPLVVNATGFGLTQRATDSVLRASALYARNRWSVVLSRPLADATVRGLRLGHTGKVAFAVWQGSNQERAGIKAVTVEWQPLEMEE
jgi:DMSO reductase family type II enzyme heme b subunit